MALKAILTADEHSALGDAFKSEYKEQDGKFVLDVVSIDGYSLEDVSGLKTSLGAERTARSAAEKKLEKFKDLDPTAARKAIERVVELEAIDPAKESDKLANTKFEAAKTQLLTRHNEELATRDARIGKLEGIVNELLVDSVAKSAIADAKGSVDLLLPHIRAQTKVREDGDRFVVDVVDEKGNGRIGDSKGGPMTIQGLVEEMKQSDRFGRAFDADTEKNGSGKRPTNSGGGMPPGGLKRSEMTPKDKRDYQQKHGRDAFLKLPA